MAKNGGAPKGSGKGAGKAAGRLNANMRRAAKPAGGRGSLAARSRAVGKGGKTAPAKPGQGAGGKYD